MHDLASVRTEIKGWERNFKSNHGRTPTVDDIKENPSIAAKYKLYKKLSKVTSDQPGVSRPSSLSRSSTPPGRPSSLLLSRAVETTAPLTSFNPFSPEKKGKQRVLPAVAEKPTLSPNPFATPTKPKPKPRIRQPSPSPSMHETKMASTSTLVFPSAIPPEPSTAVTRARKRLRGEPVSPSPNKGKRQRVLRQTHLTFTRQGDSSSSSDDDEGVRADSSFVADSPVKASAGIRSFKSLFEEQAEFKKTALSRSKTNPALAGLFGPAKHDTVGVEDDLDSVLGAARRPKVVMNGRHSSKGWFPGKDNLYTEEGSTSQSGSVTTTEMTEDSSKHRISRKRVLPDSDTERDELPSAGVTLIPPSPPPEASSQHAPSNLNKGKGKQPNRKRTKRDADEDTDSLSDEIKVLPSPSRRPRAADADDSDPDSDPDLIMQYGRRLTNSHAPKSSSGAFEVDLPDKLKHVLAIDPSDSLARDAQEERVFEHLLYGRRATHYDSSKGGEIWDVGDVDSPGQAIEGEGGRLYAEDEEDWEGEPVPWASGEL